MARETKDFLRGVVTTLEGDKNVLTARVSELEASLAQEKEFLGRETDRINTEKDQALKDQEGEFNEKISARETEIETLKEEVKTKQHQLNVRELKKFAEAYGEKEDQYEKDSDTWFGYAIKISIALIIFTALIVIFTQGVPWIKKIGYYLLDLILVTLWVFSLRQYSYYVKLRTDYGNRKALAQSYHNIVSSVDEENQDIKDKFLDKASEILAAPAEVKVDSYTMPEKLLESVTEIAKNLSKK